MEVAQSISHWFSASLAWLPCLTPWSVEHQHMINQPWTWGVGPATFQQYAVIPRAWCFSPSLYSLTIQCIVLSITDPYQSISLSRLYPSLAVYLLFDVEGLSFISEQV